MRVVLIRSTAVMPDPPVEKMANTLQKQGHEVVILAWDRDYTYDQKESMKQLSDYQVKIVHFGIPAHYSGGIKKNFKGLLQFQLRIAKWLWKNRRQFDVVHSFDFDTGFTTMALCRLVGKRFIYHILDYYVEGHVLPGRFLNTFIEFWENRVINAANSVVICTEKRIEQIRKSKPKKVFVIHNTPERCRIQLDAIKLQSGQDKTRIVYVGILADLRLLMETIRAVSRMENVEMHIGGFGHLEQEIREAVQMFDNIYFYGKLPYESTLALEAQCDIMTAIYDPSFRNHKYAAPNKFYESTMLGKPIIMARETGFDDVIQNHDIGVLTDYCESGIENAIDYLVNRKSEWKQMGLRANSVYETMYSWDIMAERIKKLYEEI